MAMTPEAFQKSKKKPKEALQEKEPLTEAEIEKIYAKAHENCLRLIDGIKKQYEEFFMGGLIGIEFSIFHTEKDLPPKQKEEWEEIKKAFKIDSYWFKRFYANKTKANILAFGLVFIKKLEKEFKALKGRVESFESFIAEIPSKMTQIATIRGDYESSLQEDCLFGKFFDGLNVKVCELEGLLSSEDLNEWQSLQTLSTVCNQWFPKFKSEGSLPYLLSLTNKEIDEIGEKFGCLEDRLNSFDGVISQYMRKKREADDTLYNFTPSFTPKRISSEFELKNNAEERTRKENKTSPASLSGGSSEFLWMRQLSRTNSCAKELSTEHGGPEKKRKLTRNPSGGSPVY